MSPDELRIAAGRLVAQRVEQGLAEHVQDHSVLARIASLVGEVAPQRPGARRNAGGSG